MGHIRLDIIYPGGAAERKYCQFAQEASKVFPCFLREFEIEPLVRRYFRTEDGLTASETPLVPETALPSLSLIHPLEGALGKPVLTANQVTPWEGLRVAGASTARTALSRVRAA